MDIDAARGEADEVGGVELDASLFGDVENSRVVPGRDHACPVPRVNGRLGQAEEIGELGVAEALDDLSMPQFVAHDPRCTETSYKLSTGISDRRVYEFPVSHVGMAAARNRKPRPTALGEALTQMREETGLTIRGMAEEAGFPQSSSYQYYETGGFKEDELPVRHRRTIARVLLERGISYDRVSRLGRIDEPDSDLAPSVMDELREHRRLLTELLNEVRQKGSSTT